MRSFLDLKVICINICVKCELLIRALTVSTAVFAHSVLPYFIINLLCFFALLSDRAIH